MRRNKVLAPGSAALAAAASILAFTALLASLALAGEERRSRRVAYTPVHRIFTCEVPRDWTAFEEETPRGRAAHLLGPSEAGGAWRAALHMHFIEKGRPGFIPYEEALKREREKDEASRREATPLYGWRIARGSARRFQVTEERLAPEGTLPARKIALHHYYALIQAGDGYIIVKLSTTRDTYLDYRDDFEHLLETFRVLGYN